MSSSRDTEFMNKYLFGLTMKGSWHEVVDICTKTPDILAAKITKLGDTALHVAVSDGQVAVVAEMMRIMPSAKALTVGNERGNTALHVAASMGSVEMCERIASRDPSLVDIRNLDGETPLFLAALHGRMHAFLCLHHIYTDYSDTDHYGCMTPSYSKCRRNNGDTILHCAIAEEYFDLAFQIIHLYEFLVDSVNERGHTPLHVLASKPSAFRSGCHLGRYENIIYHSLYVEELQVAPRGPHTFATEAGDEHEFLVPPNSQTWMDLFWILKNTVVGVCFLGYGIQRKTDEMQEQNDSDELPVAKRRRQLEPQQRLQPKFKSFFPANYITCFDLLKVLYFVLLVTVGQGSIGLYKIRRKKEKHVWSVQLMNKLLERASLYGFAEMNEGGRPQLADIHTEDETLPYSFDEHGSVIISNIREEHGRVDDISNIITKYRRIEEKSVQDKKFEEAMMETPILIAARNGVIEMVEKILELFPVSIHDTNAENKNIVLLAVESRQSQVYEYLLKRNMLRESLFRNVDKWGNSALHLAAKLGDYKPWLFHDTAALHMQWEIKWYQSVKNSVPSQYFVRYNKENKTADEIFSDTHKDLVESGGNWLKKTSESCSVVATLIATVAFATSTAIPGGVQEKTGSPNLENHPAFMISAMSSLVGLYGSVTSMVMFLSILSSSHKEYDFARALPRKLMIGLTTLFVSTIAMLVSFSAEHYLSVKNKLENAAFPIYAVASLPVVLFTLSQFPLYLETLRAIFDKLP